MKNETRGGEAAFPGATGPYDGGMTKRELIAAICLHGILARGQYPMATEHLAVAVEMADDLLEELERGEAD